jgi:hypothetical protein
MEDIRAPGLTKFALTENSAHVHSFVTRHVDNGDARLQLLLNGPVVTRRTAGFPLF